MIDRNGGEQLRASLASCIESLNGTWRRSPRFEFIFADNGSIDGSVDAARDLLTRSAQFQWRFVEDARAGVNQIRNAGLQASSGALVVFTDNDLTFTVGWLDGYLQAAAAHPSIDVFAGRVLVAPLPCARPAWLALGGSYTCGPIVVRCDLGNALLIRRFADDDGPVGPNMAMRRALFHRIGDFNVDFGLRPGSLVAGAEAEFFERLQRRGESFVYVPQAQVYHPLRRNQINRMYFVRRMHGAGRVGARIDRMRGVVGRQVCGIRCYSLSIAAVATVRYLAHLLAPVEVRFFYLCQVAQRLGYIREDFTHWLSVRTSRGNLHELTKPVRNAE